MGIFEITGSKVLTAVNTIAALSAGVISLIPSFDDPSKGDAIFVFTSDNTEFIVHSLSISPQYAAEATQNETEEGSIITDHVNRQPIMFSFSGFVSELEKDRPGGVYDPEYEGDHIKFRDRMVKAWSTGEIIKIGFNPNVRGDYSGVITSFNPNWSADSGHGFSLSFDLTLQQIDVVQTATRNVAIEQIKEASALQDLARGRSRGYIGPFPLPSPLEAAANLASTAGGLASAGVDWVR